ncbi:MAG: hypothetical protein U0S12_00445 [Fimbriimonadales bacterium]
MNRIFLRSGLATGLLAAFAVSAFAQLTYKPFMTRQVAPAVRDTTTRFNPQIDETRGRWADPSENPGIYPPEGEPNSLPLGDVTSVPRGQLGPKFAGIGGTGYFPPDCDVSVGPNHIVSVVNTNWAIFTKTGTKTFQQNFANFFGSQITGGIISDPKVFYDSVSKRWFLSILNADFTALESWQLIAVSDDSDPNGNWFKYKISTKLTDGGADFWLDYPNFGFNKDGLVFSGNMFGFTSGYFGVLCTTVPKAPMLTGAAVTASYFKFAGGGTTQLTRSTDKTTDKVFGVTPASSSAMQLLAFSGLASTPSVVTAQVAVPNWGRPRASVSSGGQQLDALDGRLLNCFYRAGKIVSAHTVLSNGRNVVRWYEFRTGSWPASGQPTLFQSGNVSPGASEDAWMPAINVNNAGDIAVVYSLCSTSIAADLYVAGRKSTDAKGTMGKPIKIGTSSGTTYTAGRWGDYFGMEVDPVDQLTFWANGMVVAPGNDWTTIIQSFKISSSSGSDESVAPTAISMFEGAQAFGNLANVTTSDDRYFSIGSAFVARTGHVASADVTFHFNKALTSYSAVTLNAEAGAIDGLSTSVFGWDVANSKWVYFGAFPVSSADAKKTIKLPFSTLSAYVDGGRNIRLLLRAVSPISPTRSPLPFNFRIDQTTLSATPKL